MAQNTDQEARKYTVRAMSHRWPIHVFYNILDLACINAHTLYKDVTKEKILRRDFILSLAKELARPYVAMRSQVPKPFPSIWGMFHNMLATTNVYSAKYPCVTKIKPETNVHSTGNRVVEYVPGDKEEYAKNVTGNSEKYLIVSNIPSS
ncbi:hypothetical protein PR048_022645 [Dryococelus australis]|uniref:PiggyBac transposable element-derived protein domain-containing protein n=1 Tax=Dryococelus australis TaxID=614101 RepID=A0ABQ9H1M0_9NEOP|nr:hypothetical protein PR048_022645 [Dryococelus australis]